MATKKEPIRGSGIVILYSDKILLLRGKPSDKWGLPKGYKEPGETLHQCATRETFEECGINIPIDDDVNSINIGVYKYYFVEIDSLPEIKIQQDEITAYNWLERKMFPKAKKMLNYGARGGIHLPNKRFTKVKYSYNRPISYIKEKKTSEIPENNSWKNKFDALLTSMDDSPGSPGSPKRETVEQKTRMSPIKDIDEKGWTSISKREKTPAKNYRRYK